MIAISAATMRGVPRPEWDLRVSLSAAKRLVSYAGLDVNVWGHASARVPGADAGKGLPHPCVSEGADQVWPAPTRTNAVCLPWVVLQHEAFERWALGA